MGQPSEAEAFRAFEAAGWNRLPDAYDDFFGPVTARAIEPLLDLAGVGAGTRLLDVAAGPGRLAGRAAARGADAAGVDLAPAMVELASRLRPSAEFRVAPAEELPYPDGAFDAVVCNFGLGHFAEPERAVAEAARVLAPGGRLALSWWGAPAKSRLLGLFHDAIAESGAAPPADLPPGPPFFRYSSGPALCELLAGAGLEMPETRRLAFVEQLGSADELWAGVIGSSVRTAAAISRQPEAVRRRIRAIFDRLCAVHRDGEELALPVVIELAAARAKGPRKVDRLSRTP